MAGPWDDFRGQAPDSGAPWDAYRSGNATPAAQEAAGGKKPKSATYQQGEGAGSAVQGLFNALNGPTLGFGDEIAGAGGALMGKLADIFGRGNGKSMADNYREVRDYVRGAQDKFSADNPILAGGTKMAAAAPVFMLGGAAPEAMGAAVATRAALPGMVSTAGQAARVGAITGTIQGAGDSTADTVGGVARDALMEGGKSALMSGVGQGVLDVAGKGVNAVRRAVSDKAARNFAQEKVAEALARSSQGDRFAIENAQDALRAMGPEARIADVGGEAGRGLLDTMATLPGMSKDAVEAAIRSRQATRGGRILSDADAALGNAGRDFSGELKQLAESKITESTPYYQMIREAPIARDPELQAILDRIPMSAWKEVAQAYKLTTGAPLDLGRVLRRDPQLPIGMLDDVKKSLYDIEQSYASREGKKHMANLFADVRNDLVRKLETASPVDEAGQNLYKLARETYGGFAGMEKAMDLGRKSMTGDALALKDTIAGLGPDQLDAFRMGAMQALRQKAGTQAGQTELLGYWKNPNMQERLQMLFGPEAGQFFQGLEREGKFKALESVGRGSQTARRQFAAGDLDVDPMAVAGAVGHAAMGNPVGVMQLLGNAARNRWNRVQTPEATRDEITRLLLSQGDQGITSLNSLRDMLTRVSDARLKRAGAAGAFTGVLPGVMTSGQ